MIHPMTITGPAGSATVRCDVCGTIAANVSDRSADIAIAQHDFRWSK